MILRVPEYYEKFSCIASRCKDSCCAGWEIDIDEEFLCILQQCRKVNLAKDSKKVCMRPIRMMMAVDTVLS